MKSILNYKEFISLNENSIYNIEDLTPGQVVKYKKNSYDEAKPQKEQPDNIGEKPIVKIDKENNRIYFNEKDGDTFHKDFRRLILPSTSEKNQEPDHIKDENGHTEDSINNSPVQKHMLTHGEHIRQ